PPPPPPPPPPPHPPPPAPPPPPPPPPPPGGGGEGGGGVRGEGDRIRSRHASHETTQVHRGSSHRRNARTSPRGWSQWPHRRYRGAVADFRRLVHGLRLRQGRMGRGACRWHS